MQHYLQGLSQTSHICIPLHRIRLGWHLRSWPEGLFQYSVTFGFRPRAMMSALRTEVTNSIIHKHASLWINILTNGFGVYSSAQVQTAAVLGYLVFLMLLEGLTYICILGHVSLLVQTTSKVLEFQWKKWRKTDQADTGTVLCFCNHGIISMDPMKWFGGLVLIIKWVTQLQSFAGKQQQKGQRARDTKLISNDQKAPRYHSQLIFLMPLLWNGFSRLTITHMPTRSQNHTRLLHAHARPRSLVLQQITLLNFSNLHGHKFISSGCGYFQEPLNVSYT